MNDETRDISPHVRRSLMPLFSVCMASLLLLAGLALFIQYVRYYERETDSKREAAVLLYQQSIRDRHAALGVAVRLIAGDAGVQRRLAARDGQGLSEHYGRVFAQFKERYGLNHLIFTDPKRRELARTLNPGNTGGVLGRSLYAEAVKGGVPATALDAGPDGGLALCMVAPVFSGGGAGEGARGDLVVFVQVGMDISDLIAAAGTARDVDLALLLNKKRLTVEHLSRVRGDYPTPFWVETGGEGEIYTTLPAMDRELARKLEKLCEEEAPDRLGGLRLFSFMHDFNYYAVSALALTDSEGMDLGELLVLRNATGLVGDYALSGLLLTALGLGIIYIGRRVMGAGLDRVDGRLGDMMSHILRAEKELEGETRYLQRIIDELPTALCIKDADKRLIMYNSNFAAIFGWDERGAGGLRHPAMPDAAMDRVLEADDKVLATGAVTSLEVEIPRAGEGHRSYLVSKRVIHGKDDEPQLLSVCTDITFLKETEKALVGLHSKAEAANVAKGEFLACMSHEMRTPLNVILGMTHLARSARPGPALDRQLEKISEAANSLLETINRILEFANAESGEAVVAFKAFSLNDLLHTVAEEAQSLPLRPGVAFESDVENFPSRFLGDPERIAQVLQNLLSNAAKFTHEGTVRLVCRLESEENGVSNLYFAVEDSGIGIPEERMDRLFTGFGQLERGHNRRYGGSGLGLALTRHYIHLMRGEIGLHSTEDKGTTFFFTLPLEKADGSGYGVPERKNREGPGPATSAGPGEKAFSTAGDFPAASAGKIPCRAFAPSCPGPAEAPDEAASVQAASAGRKLRETDRESPDQSPDSPLILVVEDNPVNQEILVELLRTFGLRSEVAGDGAQALTMIYRGYALVLMDIQMPVMDGLAAARAIRALPGGERDIPIIALTANSLPQDREACREAGMDDFLGKPVDVGLLKATLDRWLRPAVRRAAG